MLKPSQLDHRSFVAVLKRNKFYQTVKHGCTRTAGWFHECGIIAYYTTSKGSVCYIVRYKTEDYEARNASQLTRILTGFKNRKIL